jgi:hypothetical protein
MKTAKTSHILTIRILSLVSAIAVFSQAEYSNQSNGFAGTTASAKAPSAAIRLA